MRAAIYVRMSRDALGTGLGVERQLQDCRNLALQRGWIVAQVFTDNDVSASSAKPRPAYQRMLTAIEAGEVDAVVVWDLDRLTRRPVEIEHFIDLADKHGLALASIGGDADLSTDNGRLFARIKGAVARSEVERKSTRQRRANLQAVEAGQPPRRRAFGFPGLDQRPDAGGRTTPAETVTREAAAVQNAFAALLAGESLRSITAHLNQQGHTTTRGKPFARNDVRNMLLNPRYAGLRRYRGDLRGRGNWEPVVEEDTWRTATRILTDPARRTNHRVSTARLWLLAGIARCGICDDGTTCRVSYRERQRRVYACRAHAHLSRLAEPIDNLVTAVLLSWAESPAAADLLRAGEPPQLSQLRGHADTARMRLEQLAEAFADGTLTVEQMRAATIRVRTRLAEVEQEIADANRSSALDALVGEDAAAAWEEMGLDRQRAVVAAACTVTILPGRPGRTLFDPASVRIDWNHL